MKFPSTYAFYLCGIFFLFITSCQKEEFEPINEDPNEKLIDKGENPGLTFGSFKDFNALGEIFKQPTKDVEFNFDMISFKKDSDKVESNSFQLDTSKIVLASIGGNKYYTIPVKKKSFNFHSKPNSRLQGENVP